MRACASETRPGTDGVVLARGPEAGPPPDAVVYGEAGIDAGIDIGSNAAAGSNTRTADKRPKPKLAGSGSATVIADVQVRPDIKPEPAPTTTPDAHIPIDAAARVTSIDEHIAFRHGEDAWSDDGEGALARIARLLTANPSVQIRIIGYLDASENPRSSAGSRAMRVYMHLTSGPRQAPMNKIARARMQHTTGTAPVAGCRGRDLRCVEFVVVP